MNKYYLTLIVFLLLSKSAFSQIEGDVRSKDNNRIPNAVVFAMDTMKNIIDSVTTDEYGFYSFTNLKPGKYLIEAKALGFENKVYKNVIAREKWFDPEAGKDKSNATRIQIVLLPAKQKQ